MRKFKSHPYYNVEGEIGAANESAEVAAEVVNPGGTEQPAAQTESESSFARRLREHSEKEVKNARESWEKETSEKYKDHEINKEMADYLSELNGGTDLLTLKERRELEKLEQRAEKENVSPETLRRIDELEARASKGDKLEQQQQETERVTTYFKTMDDFLKDKGVESKALNAFMIENELQYNPNNMSKSFEVALKAFKADEAIAKLATAEKDAVSKYLESKKGVKVEGAPGAASAQAVNTSKMSWDQVGRHAAERVRAMNTPQ